MSVIVPWSSDITSSSLYVCEERLCRWIRIPSSFCLNKAPKEREKERGRERWRERERGRERGRRGMEGGRVCVSEGERRERERWRRVCVSE